MAYSDVYVNTYLYYRLLVEEDSSSISIANNTSVVNWYVQVGRSNYGYKTERTFSYSANIGGNTVSGSKYVTVTHDPVTIGSGSFTITHNNDGTGTCACSATVTSDKGTGYPSVSLTLSTIARASTATVPTFTLGQAGTISIDRKSSGFTHTLQWWYGDKSGTVGTGVATSVSWTPSLDLCSQTPSATSGVGRVRVTTYNGATVIGYNDYTLTCKVPESVVPAIKSVTITDTNSEVPAVVGSGTFVANKSLLKVAVSSEGVYGSSINSCTVNANGVSYSVDDAGTVTLPALSGTSVPVTVTVVDSRGRSASVTKTVTQLDYQTPQIVGFNADRCDKDGTANDNGVYIKATYAYAISALSNKNTKSVKVQYKRTSETSWSDLMTIAGAYIASGSQVSTATLSTSYQWDLRLCVQDSFSDVDFDSIVPSREVLLDFKADGKGIGIGKSAETSELVDIEWTLRAKGFQFTPDGKTVYDIDPVIDSGTKDSWQYVRHKSGLTMCCVRHLVKGIACTTAWGSLYCGVIPAFEYPFTFTEPPTETASIMASSNRCWIADYDVNTASKSAQYHIVRPTSASSVDLYINYVAIGYVSETATANEEG